jgi:hypothetical protein
MSSSKLKKTKKERKKDETRARSVVADTRVAGQGLVVKDKSVWCTPCGKWVMFHDSDGTWRRLANIFDGAKANHLVEASLVRFVDD